ncbi:XdhC family protein [Pleurocapsales cyanobacterium LEGE 10410]|nr:XdhC family protein [Pleurocapsales cyanobacterium LEGE 10410]
MNDRTFYQQLKCYLKSNPVVLATIVEVVGSAPREVAAKMAVFQDKTTIGTIGGGAGEGKVIQQASIVLKTGKKQLIEIDLTGAPGKDIQGVCGGKVRVWLERWSGEGAIALVEQILELLKIGQSANLVVPFAENAQPYLTCEPLPHSEYRRFAKNSSQFIETIQAPPTLLIIGGGHVAVALSQIASFAGFQIAVQDDRPEFITPQRFPQAMFLFDSLDETLDSLATHSQIYLALVTRGYAQDLAALQAILQSSLTYQYLGAIGSQKRIKMIRQALQQQGLSLELSNFYAPIGLDIGALTPEEIAVSICGELIKVRRGGTGLSLCERMQHSQTPLKIHLPKIDSERPKISKVTSNE